MPDLLIELFSEEIPARMQSRAREDLKKLVTDGLVEAGLTYAGAGAFSTPRRLTLTVQGLTAESRAVREERKGPSTGAPQQAIDGFLRATGLTLKGPLTTPIGGGFRSINVRLREALKLYANVRPARSLLPDGKFPDVDIAHDLAGAALLPGFVDAHTHPVFAGDRAAARCSPAAAGPAGRRNGR